MRGSGVLVTQQDRPEDDTVPGRRRVGRPGAAEEVAAALARLSDLDVPALRSEWRRLYRAEPPPRLGRALLELVVAWKLQEQILGGLSATARRQLSSGLDLLTGKADLPKPRQPRLKPGVKLIRRWGGTTHEVTVIEDGFVWNGRRWPSLSVIAREITGARWSGPKFFGLKEGPGKPQDTPDKQRGGQGGA